MMSIPFLGVALMIFPLSWNVLAHTVMTNIYVDGVNQGDGTCVRMSTDFMNASYPIEPVTNQAAACGYHGEQGVARVCPAQANSTITFEYHENPSNTSSPSLDPPHKGPCAVYMKKVDSAIADNNAAGDGWFKIYESTYDDSTSTWCTDAMIENNGHLSATIPSDIEAGYYLIRSELLALHFAYPQHQPAPDPQFYVGCAQLFVQGDGEATPNETVSIPDGYVTVATTPGLTFNIYDSPLKLPYPKFGPDVYNATTSTNDTCVEDELVQTEGLKPSNCVLENANWCGIELDSYSTQAGCWNASKSCWNQSTTCFATNPPTGAANCYIWNSKCYSLDDACEAGNYTGPPDQGKQLTPALNPLSKRRAPGRLGKKQPVGEAWGFPLLNI